MKRILLAAAAAVAIFAAKLQAEEAATVQTVSPDWHYRWHEARWWYWMPENYWMVWTGSTWVPYEQFASCPNVVSVSQAKSPSTTNGNDETQNESGTSQPAYSGGVYCPPTYSAGSGGDYAGYGWSWGPGTAYRDGPGRRF